MGGPIRIISSAPSGVSDPMTLHKVICTNQYDVFARASLNLKTACSRAGTLPLRDPGIAFTDAGRRRTKTQSCLCSSFRNSCSPIHRSLWIICPSLLNLGTAILSVWKASRGACVRRAAAVAGPGSVCRCWKWNISWWGYVNRAIDRGLQRWWDCISF